MFPLSRRKTIHPPTPGQADAMVKAIFQHAVPFGFDPSAAQVYNLFCIPLVDLTVNKPIQ